MNQNSRSQDDAVADEINKYRRNKFMKNLKNLTKAELKVSITSLNSFNNGRDVQCSVRNKYHKDNIAPLLDELNNRYAEERAGKCRESIANII